ncbi:cell division protein FtsQ/DivIB [Sungkyunkwania multivorans]|uniref:Cell division protein FtsQ/DivIB n=1 Tax=Sungkyunkwania multivorans TaxID=1173618 RepID=A0ABW3D218_9FLAO
MNWNYIKLIGIFLLLSGLFAFTNARSDAREISEVTVIFQGENNLYITREAVNKLLIQKRDSIASITKDALVLNQLETALKANELIRDAQVYLTVNGQLGAKVRQRTPIARVSGDHQFYVDSEGTPMPLSPYYSARVPIVTGDIDKNHLQDIYALTKFINDDAFLRKNVVALHKTKGEVVISLRELDFEVIFGKIVSIEKKFNNLKAFYKKGMKDRSLDTFKTVSLEFESQVVCTKK